MESANQKHYHENFHNFLNSFTEGKSVAHQKEKTFIANIQKLRGIHDHQILGDPYSNLSDDGENFTQPQSQNFPE